MVLASIVQFLADIAVTQTADVAAQAAPAADELTFWNMAVKGGWIMIFLALFSIVAVYIIVERAFAITKAAKEDVNFMNEVKNFVAQGKIEEAHIRCQGTDSPVARMIDKGISRIELVSDKVCLKNCNRTIWISFFKSSIDCIDDCFI